jgi:hypothetical protein
MKTKNYFQGGTCNTICDRTGFKVKLSDTVKTWDGYQVIPEANALRNPQDFAPSLIKTTVHKDSRAEQFYNTDTITAPDII